MKLILMRHMKSDWDGMTTDHERPLNKRGKAAAPKIGAWLKANAHQPDLALISDATRTTETFAGLADYMPSDMKTVYSRKLYLSEPIDIVRFLAKHEIQENSTVLIVAHNPGIATLAATLVAGEPKHPRFYDYPTGATTVLEFDGEIAPETGRLLGFVIPREL